MESVVKVTEYEPYNTYEKKNNNDKTNDIEKKIDDLLEKF